MKRLHILILLLALVPAAATLPGPTAAQESGWRVESVRPLATMVEPVSGGPSFAVIPAPDGRHVLFEQGGDDTEGVCSLDVVTGAQGCVPVPRELARIRVGTVFPSAAWSDDGTRAALVGNPLMFFQDSDLGLADFADLSFSNLSDDGYEDNYVLRPEAEGAWMEVQPVWSPDGTQIAVERTRFGAEGRAEPSHITVFDLDSGATREVTAIPGVGYEFDAGSIVAMDWSPDGSTLAFSVRHIELNPIFDGIWLVDAAGGLPQRLVTMPQALEAFQIVYPEDETLVALTSLHWSPDGERLLYWVGDPGGTTIHNWAFWMEIDTGTISPVPLPASTLDQGDSRARWPSHAAWSPDGDTLLVVARESEPPDLEQAPLLFAADTGMMQSLQIIDVATQGYTLLGYLPTESAELFNAAWGPEGDVIIAGFSFKLTRE